METNVNSKQTIANSNSKKISHFTDLIAWQICHQVELKVYKLTKKFPKEEIFGITSQLRRATSSMTANVAEGWGRYHFADKIRFYYQSRGSNTEAQNHLNLSKDLGYLTENEFNETMKSLMDCLKVINGLIRSVEKHKPE